MKHILITAALLLAAGSAISQDTLSRPEGQVHDLAGILKPEEKTTIEGIIGNLQQSKGALGFLLVIDSLPAGQNILNYTKGVFKKWDLNNHGAGMNFIIVYAVKNHAVRIEGSDDVIELTTKQYLQDVTTNSMMPYFRKRQDFQALKRGMEMVALKLENN